MRRMMIVAAIGAGALAALGPAPARADSYWELEHARANARALHSMGVGRGDTVRDAELLKRYGCLSGTGSAFCKKLSQRDKRAYRQKPRRARRN